MLQDGCWVGFDDFHLLTKQSVSTFMFGAQTLYDNLKAKLNTCILGDGKEVSFFLHHFTPDFGFMILRK